MKKMNCTVHSTTEICFPKGKTYFGSRVDKIKWTRRASNVIEHLRTVVGIKEAKGLRPTCMHEIRG